MEMDKCIIMYSFIKEINLSTIILLDAYEKLAGSAMSIDNMIDRLKPLNRRIMVNEYFINFCQYILQGWDDNFIKSFCRLEVFKSEQKNIEIKNNLKSLSEKYHMLEQFIRNHADISNKITKFLNDAKTVRNNISNLRTSHDIVDILHKEFNIIKTAFINLKLFKISGTEMKIIDDEIEEIRYQIKICYNEFRKIDTL